MIYGMNRRKKKEKAKEEEEEEVRTALFRQTANDYILCVIYKYTYKYVYTVSRYMASLCRGI